MLFPAAFGGGRFNKYTESDIGRGSALVSRRCIVRYIELQYEIWTFRMGSGPAQFMRDVRGPTE